MPTPTTEYHKFLPEGIPPRQMPFWEPLKTRAVKVQGCNSSSELTWTPISGHGEIYTYTAVQRAPRPATPRMHRTRWST
jgi:hypothetical protein